MTENTPFFVVGSGRSGTTLLRLILSGHSRIHIPPETWFITDLVRELPLATPLASSEVSRAVELITSDYRWHDMQIPAEDFERWAAALDRPKLVDIVNLVYRHHLQMHQKQRFGDKTPRYIQILPQLQALYPGAKFIHLIRDGRDVAISFINAGWYRYYDRKSFEWTAAMRQRRQYLQAPWGAQIFEVRFEDLIADLEGTVRTICEFLNEEFEPQMLHWQELTHLVPERERSAHRRLANSLDAEVVGAWRRKASRFERFAIESCLYGDLPELGYRLHFSGAAWRPFLIAAGWSLSAMAPLLLRGIPYLQRRNLLPKEIYF